MKRYTVKQVIKMEERQQKLHEIAKEGDGEFYFMPLALITTLGVSSVLDSMQSLQTIPLILGAVLATYGIGELAHLFSAGFRSDLLYDKLNNIYDVMGEDFKKQVEEEMFRQQQEYGKSR